VRRNAQAYVRVVVELCGVDRHRKGTVRLERAPVGSDYLLTALPSGSRLPGMNGRTRLAGYLNAKKLSQGEFARQIGTSSGVVNRWLNGKRVPDRHWALVVERQTGGAVPVSSWEEEPAPQRTPAKGKRPVPRRAAARVVRHDRNIPHTES
jgi:hypothetical protein